MKWLASKDTIHKRERGTLSNLLSKLFPYRDDNIPFLKDLYNILFLKPIKNHIFRVFLFGVSIMLLFKSLEYFGDEPNIFTIIMALISMFLIMPVADDFVFYSAYFNAIINLEKLMYRNYGKDEKSISTCNNYLDDLQYNLHLLRNILKRRIKKANSAFLTYDEEIKKTMAEIDVFFETLIKLIFRTNVKNIIYTPEDSVEITKDSEIYHPIKYCTSDGNMQTGYLHPSDFDLKLKSEYYVLTLNFLEYLGNISIRKKGNNLANLFIMSEFFKKWNSKLESVNQRYYKETRLELDIHLEKVRSRKYEKRQQYYELTKSIVTSIMGTFIAIFISFGFAKLTGVL